MPEAAPQAGTRVPVTLVSGFLGAGKTTLLRRLLADPRGVRYGVLVNDFGALDVDAELIADLRPDRVALSNGCVCCSIRDDLVAAALGLLRGAAPPERLLVETSGVSDPAAVANALLAARSAPALAVDAVWCLVDAAGFADLDYADTEFAIDQAAAADLVLLNKCDLASGARVDDVERTLLGALPSMRLLRTERAELPPAVLRGAWSAREARFTTERTHGYEQRAWTAARPLAVDAFRDLAALLAERTLRAKGLVALAGVADQTMLFQSVGRRASLEAWTRGTRSDSRLVAIGAEGWWRDGRPDRAAAAAGLAPVPTAARPPRSRAGPA